MTEEKTKFRTPVRKRGIDTRDMILQAAKDLFFEKGYERTSIKDIASRAGIAVGTIYSYFKDKTALINPIVPIIYEEMLSRVFSLPIDDLVEKGDTRGLVRALLKSLYDAHAVEAGVYKELMSMAMQDQAIADFIKNEELKYLEYFEGFLQIAPQYLKIKDFAAAAEMVYRVSDEIIHRICFFGTKNDGQRLLKELEDMLCAYLFHEFPAEENS